MLLMEVSRKKKKNEGSLLKNLKSRHCIVENNIPD